jgi:uncharacterized protein
MSLVLIVVTHGPDTPEMCGAPFFFAQTAAVQDNEVCMLFTMKGTRLMKRGVGATVFPKKGAKSIQHFIRETSEKGVQLNVCAASLELNDMTEDDLVDEVDNLVGSAYLINQGLESDLVLNF